MTQIGSPQKDPHLNTVIRPPLKIAQGGKDKRGGVPFLVSSKNGDIQKNSEDGKKKTGHLEQCQEQEVIQEQEVFQERVGVPPRDEREKYNEFFEAKMYLPPLRASKRELNFFFKILSNAMEKNNKSNIYISLMDILCKNFPSYIGLFAHLWFQCKVLLAEKLILIEFFRQLKINSEIINHFFNYGYDSFETILSITPQDLANVQEFNKVTWLPGHTFRLKMIFSQIEKYFNLFIQQNDDYVQKIKKFILSKRRRTELTLQLSLERQQNDRGQCPMYGPHVGNNTNLPLPPEGTQDVNIITYQQYVSDSPGKPLCLNKFENYEQVRKKNSPFSLNLKCVQGVGRNKTGEPPRGVKSKVSILITSPEGAKIYRFVAILLIYNLVKREAEGESSLEGIHHVDHDAIKEVLNFPIVSIGKSCNAVLNNDGTRRDLSEMFQSVVKEFPKCKINQQEFHQLNKSVKNLNIVFTPSKANSVTLHRELTAHLAKHKGEGPLNAENIIWVASSISESNFDHKKSEFTPLGKKREEEKNRLTITRINCYDTKKVTYNKNQIEIRRNSIICLMSNSTVASFFQNFGNDFAATLCMGRNSSMLAKKLNFKQVLYPEDSKMESFLIMLIKLHNELGERFGTQHDVVLTRERGKNGQLGRALTEQRIPYRVVPCIRTHYHGQGIRSLYSILSSQVYGKKKRGGVNNSPRHPSLQNIARTNRHT
ncbi:hypothetical protein PVIIG_01529 [Plasmodium vivax India VII]|uniref:Uroporphyrinogen-III synthase n=3 Tax=Plasmodium vivax TaxID=5855 RepID=A5K8X8_PLAVS|nr:hypothetical protein, conserved [Plasmodium vivax]EDL44274.1 hypothetical protein, conserved [Plasmodium vivax]KMZ77560.1 hypothetical protein PVIIG_01529 [Plasmodium vivax India VII]KMZ96556.1 hypothetical protein PVNG_01953 [Plasmodium vivax North Korean]|eukprot:XP_001614001.1 hypothetical protein [Plasmodium vivax Sal-1]